MTAPETDALDLERIDQYLAGLASVTTDAELRNHFATFHCEQPGGMPADPFSTAYRDRVLAMYAHLSGRTYAPSNEVTMFDVDAALVRPFPFGTGSAVVVGDHLMQLGQLVRALEGLDPGASVLDCGAGWGNTTMAFAQSGFRVTAIEVEPRFVDLIAARAAKESVDVEVIADDFLSAFEQLAAAGRTFDAVVFFESFHHCDDPVRLVGLIDRVVSPGGCALFGAEPISAAFPIPWGLRLDGESLWAIRSNGWMELGFRSDFFDELLGRYGWLVAERSLLASPADGTVHVARRAAEFRTDWTFGNGLRSMVGTRSAVGVSTDGRDGYLVFGPYTSLPRGPWRFTAHLDVGQSIPEGRATVDVAFDRSRHVVARRCLELEPGGSTIVVDAQIPAGVEDLEFRIHVDTSTRMHVTHVEVVRLEHPVVKHVELDRDDRISRLVRMARRVPVLGPRLVDVGRVVRGRIRGH